MQTISPITIDREILITFFDDRFATTKSESRLTIGDLIEGLNITKAPSKAALPWLKLASFGNLRSARGSLRHDENIIEIFGIEADYDAGEISLDHARSILSNAGLAAVLYTSPSHTPAAPRWRILCPTSDPMPPAKRAGLVARLNGLFNGALADESFTLSQAYYFGAIEGNESHQVLAVDGRSIDLAIELDARAIGRPSRAAPTDTGLPASPRAVAVVDASPYAREALERECDNIRHAGEGSKYFAVNKAGWAIGGLVTAGELLEGDAYAALTSALESIHSQCKDFRAAQRALLKAFREGKGQPRDVPERIAPPADGEINAAAPFLEKLDAQRATSAAKPKSLAGNIMAVEGALKMFIDYCEATAISSQPFLALACGLTAIGALAGRNYRSPTNLRTNLYTVGLGESGAGKDHARKQLKNVLQAAGLTRFAGGEDLASGSAMMTALGRHPAMMFSIDEFGDFLHDVIGPKAATHKKQIAQRLKTLFSSAASFISGTEYADQSKIGRPREDIQNPHACIYGTSTPGQFWHALADASMEDGLLARFLIFLSPESYPDEKRPTFIDPPAALVEAFKAIAAGPGGGDLSGVMLANVAPEAYLVPMTADAENAYYKLREDQLKRQRKNVGTRNTAIPARLAEHATKLALVRAISRDPISPRITVTDMEWSRTLAEHCVDTLLREADENIAETPHEKLMQRILKAIRKRGSCSLRDFIKSAGIKATDRERE